MVNEEREKIKEKLKDLPNSPGVYLMKNKEGEIIYIGKANNLRNRVRSYFQSKSGDSRYLLGFLEKEVADIDIIVTRNEKEALILENNLIKEHSPRYNIRLKDDKDFLYIMINLEKDYPYLELIRRASRYFSKGGKIKFFGPYHSAKAARKTVKVVSRYFKLRVCSDTVLKSRKRACVLHQLGYCSGPCIQKISPQEYKNYVSMALLFLSGKYSEVISKLKEEMTNAAKNLEFEKATYYRDQIRAIELTMGSQAIALLEDVDVDLLGYCLKENTLLVSIIKVREGKIIYKESFNFKEYNIPLEEGLPSFLMQYYLWIEPAPIILLPLEIEGKESLEEYLSEKRGAPVSIKVPKKGIYKQLLDIAMENATTVLNSSSTQQVNIDYMLSMIKYKLNLKKTPHKIECVDIAHTGGDKTTASIAVMVDGEYRGDLSKLFHVKSEGGDDYLAMYEVLKRRFTHWKQGDKGWELPELLVVDGGKGQLNVAKRVIKEFGLNDLDVIAIAKGEKRKGDTIYTTESKLGIKVKENSYLFLISKIRDEAHRLAGKLHSIKWKKIYKQSLLDNIPNIGETRKKLLLEHFQDIEEIKKADLKQLESIKGIGRKVAEQIYKYFHNDE